jgi:putative tryptophan/tyrosine transport system substrate-binding protein
MHRREFIAMLAGAVTATSTLRPRAASAQQAEKVRRVSVLMGLSDSTPEFRALVAAFVEELARLGWADGRNVRIEQRWTNADLNRTRALAKEMVATRPDVILTSTTPATAALKRESSTIPIVFTIVSDPVGAGFVASLARPGGNITGFTHTDAGLGGKWLGLLKEIAPPNRPVVQRIAAASSPLLPSLGPFGLVQCCKEHPYSITSSALARSTYAAARRCKSTRSTP